MTTYAFSPAMTGGTVGLTQSIVMASGAPTAGTVTIASGPNVNTMLVTNTATLAAFVRVSTTPSLTATSSDTPIPASGAHVLAIPSGTAVYAYAIPQATLGAGASVYFTPGEGGGGF
jgi:hypothetical protein